MDGIHILGREQSVSSSKCISLVICTVKIVHQLSKIKIAPILAVYIKNMFPFVKRFTRGEVNSLYGVDWLACAVEIFLNDENRVSIR